MMDGKRFEGGRFCFVFGSGLPAVTMDVTASGEGWVSGETVHNPNHGAGSHVVIPLASIAYARDEGGRS
jgi:hypothetical protein